MRSRSPIALRASAGSGCGGTASVMCRSPAAKRCSSASRVLGDLEAHARDRDVVRVVEVRIALHDEVGLRRPRQQPVRTVADQPPGRVCCAPNARDRRQVHRKCDRQGQQRRQRALRLRVEHAVRHPARPRPRVRGGSRPPCTACALSRRRTARRKARLSPAQNARRKLATTCGASSTSPSLQRSPSRRSNVQVRPSGNTRQRSAMPGTSRPRVLGHQPFVEVAQHVAAGHFLAPVRVQRTRLRARCRAQADRARGGWRPRQSDMHTGSSRRRGDMGRL